MAEPDLTPRAFVKGVWGSTEWECNDGVASRIVYGQQRGIGNDGPTLRVSAVQYLDGRFDVVADPASILVCSVRDRGLTAAHARVLAALLTHAADELDRWVPG
ncbi:hypothetical protein [Mycolicibacterium fortuitum]|jgi:hypothetical protein|uniref:Uncharacterized protein n=1 Tax=Mycolicibacterium fortuitum TaxID=1766 RepID=A0AAE4VL62_MYCFO|nr:hypothetical protein [Mycolicibacterium fortuitum]MCA4725231.1 hypothetical protein [Mycolicibacterium fortuitum]MCA4756656.1 hypothetical protein [Mycolicibacterium fortuitum]MDG5769154.1 hypothetical protein [Mycolicibacterium fortuitum]MDG5780014.1 hypothetical protein [Mycolicibacterium fortuitum]MDV7195694.1 hypothetical protein [Mycolicibacterium fortuitum]